MSADPARSVSRYPGLLKPNRSSVPHTVRDSGITSISGSANAQFPRCRLTRSWESRLINTSVFRECSWVSSAGRHWKRPEGRDSLRWAARKKHADPPHALLLAVSLEVFGHEVTYAFGSVAPVREHLGVGGGV